ncbi:MAG TPA: TatD family deoxyribonuclease [Candidatus Cloacimonetes bacterium]|nr:TatD family deoxyribonuclease [Candidatus Cloacimonadota bacterium]HEX38185.1 TatD family deoxyribonuclease [Candidatus Cloacimonadota bacterium]
MKFIDTHAHLQFDFYDKDRDEVIRTAFEKGIKSIINIGTDGPTSKMAIELARDHKNLFATAGWHPHDVTKYDEKKLLDFLEEDKVVALGEIGLDYYRNLSSKKLQKEVFETQIKIGIEKNLPLVIHDRNAHQDTFDILKKYHPEKVVFHCFSGDYTFAQDVLEQGWFISFTGVVTFDKGSYYGIIRDVPDDKYFVETDAPFLTPYPYRGKRNRPEYVEYIIQQIAEIKQKTPIEIARQTTENAENFFCLNKKLD